MPRKQPNLSPPKTALEKRAEVKDYIRNERDTILMKWRCLEENVATMDRQSETFKARMERQSSKRIPLNIQKFINTLKRKVRKTIQAKGGTPFSIVRALFLYWGTSGSASNAMGTLTTEQLSKCMQSLGVRMTNNELEEVVAYYSANSFGKKTGPNEMSYDELLNDINAAEPTIIEFSGPKYFEAEEAEGLRFKEHGDDFAVMPKLVKQFIEVSQNWIMTQMRAEGGTPHQHVRELFNHFDYSQSHGLKPNELQLAATKKMKLSLTQEQAAEIVKFYDRRHEGHMPYEQYLKDVTKGTKPILAFNEITAQERQKAIKSLQKNPLVPRPFHPKPNKILEEVKVSLKKSIAQLIDLQGGALASWLHDSFATYDKAYSHTLHDWRDVQGAFRKVMLNVSKEEALCVMRSYDVDGDGKFHFELFIKDLEAEESHFLKPSEQPKAGAIASANSGSARTPADIAKIIQRFRSAVLTFVRKSNNVLKAPDLLYGTFLSHDAKKSGRAPPFAVSNVAQALGVTLTEAQVHAIVDWFDTNATHTLDYNSFTRHLFGGNALTETLVLPKLNKAAGKADYKEELTYKQGERYLKDGVLLNEATSSLDTVRGTVDVGGGGASSGGAETATAATTHKEEAVADKPARSTSVVGSIFAMAKADALMKGAVETTPPKLNPVIESPADKKKRLDSKRVMVMRERELIKTKLVEVDRQRKQLQDDHNKRRNQLHEAELAEAHKAAYASRVAKRVSAGLYG
jgi:Ca2+-binding EF-hand superfamily protein